MILLKNTEIRRIHEDGRRKKREVKKYFNHCCEKVHILYDS